MEAPVHEARGGEPDADAPFVADALEGGKLLGVVDDKGSPAAGIEPLGGEAIQGLPPSTDVVLVCAEVQERRGSRPPRLDMYRFNPRTSGIGIEPDAALLVS